MPFAIRCGCCVLLLCVQARDGALAVEEMDGGTFTISNGGVFGSLMGTPIINPPQSAILGMHATKDRPVAIDGKVCSCTTGSEIVTSEFIHMVVISGNL